MNKKELVVALPIMSFVWFASTVLIAGSLYPQYNHVTQFISELGATGAPHGAYVNYLGFIPTEVFILGFIYISYFALPRTKKNTVGLFCIAIYGLTLGVAAVFPCDFQCDPDAATLSHHIHIASAFPGYLVGIAAMVVLSSSSASWSQSKRLKIVGYCFSVLALFAFVSMDPDSNLVGLSQRILETLIYSWLILFGYTLSKALPIEREL